MVINPVKSVKSLGVTFDDELKLAKHVKTVCRSSYYQIRQFKHIRLYLDFDSASSRQHWCIHSSQAELITVTVCSHQHIKLTNYNVCWIQQLACCFVFQDLTVIFESRSRTNFIGCSGVSNIQVVHTCLQVATWLGSRIPCGALHPCSQGLLPSISSVSRLKWATGPKA